MKQFFLKKNMHQKLITYNGTIHFNVGDLSDQERTSELFERMLKGTIFKRRDM